MKVTKTLLKKIYWANGASIAQIAQKFHCHPSTIHRKMKQYNIKSRPLSEAKRIFMISKKDLRESYEIKKLSTCQIAKKFEISHATVLNRMKKFKIPRRSKLGTRKPVIVPMQTLKELYLNRKLSQTQIARKMKCSLCAIQKLMKKYRIKSRTLSESQMKYPKHNFSGNLIEKAYLIGFRLGDLKVVPAKLQIQIDCSTSRPEQIELIKNLFRKYTKVRVKQARFIKRQLIADIRCLLNKSFNFLLPKQDKIESWIFKNPKLFFAFLAGYIDAEGHIFVRLLQKSKIPTAGLQVQSYDKNILQQIWRKANELNIKCPKPLLAKPKGYEAKPGVKNKKDLWRLSVNRKGALLKLFTNLKLYIKHKKRKQDLCRALHNIQSRL